MPVPIKDNGFLYVVSKQRRYVEAAKMSAASLKDHYPDAHITLCVPPYLRDKGCDDVFDHIISNKNVPDCTRTKLWGMVNTPYNNTLYLDADTVVESAEISTAFDQLGDNDILFTKIRLYNSNPTGVVKDSRYMHHGGIVLYKQTALPFISEWWDRWAQVNVYKQPWPYDPFPRSLAYWDQFFLFYMINHTNHGLKIDFFDEEARWNYIRGYLRSELKGKSPIIRHFTLTHTSVANLFQNAITTY